MTDVAGMLARQTEWQKQRKLLTWPEKVRMAERIRDSLCQLRPQAKPLSVPPKP